uniref:Uncharacterized protein n=1 Tax=Romanomermis culicivorax TaxID=13658 RepID=A0A915LAD9_ROMCU
YVPGKKNAFADFLSRKYKVDQTKNNDPTTSKAPTATDINNLVETRAKTRQKLKQPPQNDLEVHKTPDEEKILNWADLPNQDQWPLMQHQSANAQKIDPRLDQTHQKYLLFENLTTIHNEVLKELRASEAMSK